MGVAVVSVSSGGLPVTTVTNGMAVTEATNKYGLAVTQVANGLGRPVTFVSESGAVVPPLTPGTWNPADKTANITLSNGNLTATAASSSNQGVRATKGLNTGKNYFELKFSVAGSISSIVGLQPLAQAFATAVATTGRVIVNLNGVIYLNGVNVGSLSPLSAGTILGLAVDFIVNRFWVRVTPSGLWNASAGADPSSNTGGLDISAVSGVLLYPVFSTSLSTDACVANFGASSFNGATPSGFTAGWPA